MRPERAYGLWYGIVYAPVFWVFLFVNKPIFGNLWRIKTFDHIKYITISVATHRYLQVPPKLEQVVSVLFQKLAHVGATFSH